MTKNTVPKGLPWYRYPYVWILLIAIPLLTLIGSAVTIYLAVSSSESGVHESYYKKGISPNELAAKEQLAADQQLSGQLTVAADKLVIQLNQNVNQPTLDIKFQHPTLAKNDFNLLLTRHSPGANTYTVASPDNLRQNNWDIFIDSPESHWRIKGRLLKNEHSIALTPFGQ